MTCPRGSCSAQIINIGDRSFRGEMYEGDSQMYLMSNMYNVTITKSDMNLTGLNITAAQDTGQEIREG